MRVNYYVDITISTNETFFQVFFIMIYIFHEWIILQFLCMCFLPLWASLMAQKGKESTFNVEDTGDIGLILGLGRSPGVGNGNPLQ